MTSRTAPRTAPPALTTASQMLQPRLDSIAALCDAQSAVQRRRAAITAAQDALAEEEAGYRRCYAQARDTHGWSAVELDELGFAEAAPRARRRGITSATAERIGSTATSPERGGHDTITDVDGPPQLDSGIDGGADGEVGHGIG